jgi:hypothetical protein
MTWEIVYDVVFVCLLADVIYSNWKIFSLKAEKEIAEDRRD